LKNEWAVASELACLVRLLFVEDIQKEDFKKFLDEMDDLFLDHNLSTLFIHIVQAKFISAIAYILVNAKGSLKFDEARLVVMSEEFLAWLKDRIPRLVTSLALSEGAKGVIDQLVEEDYVFGHEETSEEKARHVERLTSWNKNLDQELKRCKDLAVRIRRALRRAACTDSVADYRVKVSRRVLADSIEKRWSFIEAGNVDWWYTNVQYFNDNPSLARILEHLTNVSFVNHLNPEYAINHVATEEFVSWLEAEVNRILAKNALTNVSTSGDDDDVHF
jgi:hypothetical protein